MPLHPTGDLSVDSSLLDRRQQRLGLGDRQAEILWAFRHLLEGGDLCGRTGGAVVLGDLQQDLHAHGTPSLADRRQVGFPQDPEWKAGAVSAVLLSAKYCTFAAFTATGLQSGQGGTNWRMASLKRAAIAVAAILVREGIDYAQSKAVFKAARERAGLRAAPERRGSVDRLSVEEELRFLDQAYARDGRTGMMLQTLLETGARSSELVQLRVEDVSLAERVITIRQGKGGKRREVPIRRELAQLLRLHIGTRRAGPLFASRQEGSGPTPHVLTRQRVGQIVRAVAVAAGIGKRVYPHLLRHTVATRLLALGMDITDLQRFLGHESIATTRLYAETTAATLQRRFDQLTDPAAHALVAGIRRQRGDEAALLAAELMAQRRAERVTTTADA
jgi:integrase/recombinase XerD